MKEYKFKINGNEYNVAVKKVEGKIAEVNVNGVDYSVEMENAPAAAAVAAAAVDAEAALLLSTLRERTPARPFAFTTEELSRTELSSMHHTTEASLSSSYAEQA